MKKTLLILLIITGITESCKKYEDGPLISLRSPKDRLYGAYTLTKYTVNGEDSLSLFYDSLGLIFQFFYDDVGYYDVCYIVHNRKDGGWAKLYWHWSFENNEMNLKIDNATGTTVGTGPFGINKKPVWEILKLTNKQIRMKTTYNNKEYFIDLISLK